MKKVIKNKKIIAMLVVGLVAIFLAAGGVIASPPIFGDDPPVESKINYQGQLTNDAGNPLDGTYDMEFRFYNSATGGSPVGSTITENDVAVTNGLFNVKLDVGQSDFNGQGLWLEVKVGGETLSPRQEILPVPYALSLKPGAEISGEKTARAVLTVMNSGEDYAYGIYSEAFNTGDWQNYGGYFVADGSKGRGVYGKATNTGDAINYGGFFYASGVQGRGVFGQAEGDSGIGVKGWASDDGDVENYGGHFCAAGMDGVGVYGWAENTLDVENYGGKFLAEGTYGIGVYAEATGTDGTGIYAKGGQNGYAADFDGNVIVKGDVEYDGALVGAFPRPAYDSGWVLINQDEHKTLVHNVGGHIDDYVVDLTYKSANWGITNMAYGGLQEYDGSYYGVVWWGLTSKEIEVRRFWDDQCARYVRVRIWVYQ